MIIDRYWPEAPLLFRPLKPGVGDPFASESPADGRLRCLRGQGRSSYLPLPAGGCTLLLCFRGTLAIDSVDGVFHLRRRHFLCLPNTAFARVLAEPSSDWMALRLSQSFLCSVPRSRAFQAQADPLLLPAVLPLSRALARSAAGLLRMAAGVGETCADEHVGALLLAALHAQSDSSAWLQRAYGRSERHRRQVVVRLLSARNRIVNAPFMDHDLDTLAAAAMYSPSHFLRSFRDVFGMTPHGLLTEARMAMARELMLESNLAICEIAASVGYGSRHAFSRLFKRQTGLTASGFRAASLVCEAGS